MNVKHYVDDKLLVFEITEDLDHHVTEKIRRRADYEIQRFMPKRVVLDFNRVVFMDSAGIGLVIGRYKTTCCYGGKLEMINVSSKIRKIFEMSGILKIIPDNFSVIHLLLFVSPHNWNMYDIRVLWT